MKLAESERKRYNLSISDDSSLGASAEEREKGEERKLVKIIRAVLNTIKATSNVPDPEAEAAFRDEEEENQVPYYVPGARFIMEVDTEEDRKMKARAEVKLEKILAEKRKREAEAEQPGSMFSGNPQCTSTPAFDGSAPR